MLTCFLRHPTGGGTSGILVDDLDGGGVLAAVPRGRTRLTPVVNTRFTRAAAAIAIVARASVQKRASVCPPRPHFVCCTFTGSRRGGGGRDKV